MQEEIYVLLEDSEGTMFSRPIPTGEFVLTEEEAAEWGGEKIWSYGRDYVKCTLRKGTYNGC